MALMPGLLARPHVLALPAMMGWTVLLVRAREDGRAPPLWAGGVMCLWANLHGGFFAGLVLAGALAVEAVWQARGRMDVVLGWMGFLAFSGLMALATPHGAAGLLFPLHMMALTQKSGIQEWAPPDFSGFEPLVLILPAVLFLGLVGRARLPLFRVLVVLGLAYGALRHARLGLQLAVFGFLILAPFAVVPGNAASARPAGRGRERERAALAALLLALTVVRLAMPLERAEDAMAPRSALAAVPASVLGTPVLNEYHLGGFLIFNGVAPFIDSRADLYGDRRLEEYAVIAAGQDSAVVRALEEWKIGWVIAAPGSALATWFEGRAGWQRAYGDGFAVVFVRG
jgi:hypothetical protein